VSNGIYALLTRLQQVIRTAEINDSHDVSGLGLLQECIDKAADAVSALIEDASRTDRKHLIVAGVQDFLALRSGGRSSLARTTLACARKIIDRVVERFETAFDLNRPVLVDDLLAGLPAHPISEENAGAQVSAVSDAAFAQQIGQLTQLDILSQTCGSFSRRPPRQRSSVLDIDPDA
jgi:hypothetical protein